MAELLTRQLQLQRSIERYLDNFKKIGRANLTPAKIRSRISSLKESWSQFQEGHSVISRTIPEATQGSIAYFKAHTFEETEEVYQTTLDHLAEHLEELEPPVSPNQSLDASPNRSQFSPFALPHLPPIRLPPFSGSYDEWEHFRDRFTALIIKNKDLSDFARMHFLTSCVTGRALECIRDVPVTADGFSVAWAALLARYANKRRTIGIHLSTLFNLTAIHRESASDLQALLDKVNVAVASLQNLQRTPAELWNDALVHIISQGLDASTRKAWNLRAGDSDEPSSFEEFIRFLAARARALEACNADSVRRFPVKPTVPRIHSANASASANSSCPLCGVRHYFSACPTFARKNPSQRRELVRQHNRCFNCLSRSHAAQDCTSKYTCRICQRRHHTMLHDASDSSSRPSGSAQLTSIASTASELKPAINSLLSFANPDSRPPVLLATAMVKLRVSSGRAVAVRALLDQGSEMTFISERLAQLLRAKRIRMPMSVSAVGGVHAGTFRHATDIIVSPLGSRTPSFTTTALILKSLTSYHAKRVSGLTSLSHLADLQWADSNPCSSEPINLIIGADLYGEVILDGLRRGELGQPIAQNSIFGWIISGPIPSTPRTSTASNSDGLGRDCINISVHHCLSDSSLDKEIRRFWEIEDLPRPSSLTLEEIQCEEHFVKTHSRDTTGRYIVRLPFKTGPPIEIGESRSSAEKILARRLRMPAVQAREYNEFLADYERLGHMRRAPCLGEPHAQHVYLPHHPVLREKSATTHLRVVFNASYVTSNGSSLNSHLLIGPKLQTDLASIVLKWRQYKYVYTTDIAKMYRQIRIDDQDLNYQRILWKPANSDSSIKYQLLTVTYGMSCAPFLALRVLKQMIADEGSPFPLATSILRDNIYVDDILFGGDDLGRVREARDQLIALLNRGGFSLRKWASNSPFLLSDIKAADHGLACSQSLSPTDKLSILGIEWRPALDVFQFSVSLSDRLPERKRTILSAIAKLYDPLGWVTPVVITAKILMQQLWKSNCGWDDKVPDDILARWKTIYTRLSDLGGVQVPRWTGFGGDIVSAELHGFADASSVAYAAVVYFRIVQRTGITTVTLLAGKSRVAPLTPLSIPRLELSAAVLLARLFDSVRSSLGSDVSPRFCWTDSTIVLAWLRQHPSRWKTFVANRVASIQELLPHAEWRHVPTEENPADCASRGLLGNELLNHPLWWHGPSWLRKPKGEWPNIEPSLTANSPLEEKVISLHITQPREPWDLVSRFSSWPKLVRVTAYLIRFVSRCRKGTTNLGTPDLIGRALSASECNSAKLFWLKSIQAVLFPTDITALSNRRFLPAKSPILPLNPFLDPEGVLRVGGRLNQAPTPFATRHPVLLAAHPIVKLIIHQAHQRALHAGPQLTLSILRQDYWILRARSLVKAVIQRCVTCTRERAAIPSQLMGNLPPIRVSVPGRCFSHCGLDYAGPVQVRVSSGRGRTSRKAYIALFVCLATRAIHLELVSDCSTSAFIGAYSRFIARRGPPLVIYSDNGSTFVGADREMTSAYRASIRDPDFQNRTATDGIDWKFIPPSAPHFGGIWEAGVRSVKLHLRRVLGKHTLTYEEFTTLLCRIEACLNSRPIAPLSDTLGDYEILTPGHFLTGSAITANPEPSLLDTSENRLTRWQIVRRLTEQFWKIWRNDYVNTLQQRSKWRKVQPSMKVGQLVLLRNPTLPPCKWDLGRVTQCHPGADGLTRVVTVRTATSEYKRPIVKLCVLPVDCEPPKT